MQLNIVYSFDDNYCEVAAVSMRSLLENNVGSDVAINLLGNHISNDKIEKMKDMTESFHQVFRYFDVSERLKKYEHLDRSECASIFGWLFIAEVMPADIRRCLYIDGDTIIVGKLSELFSLDMEDNILGGVCDVFCPPLQVRKRIGVSTHLA